VFDWVEFLAARCQLRIGAGVADSNAWRGTGPGSLYGGVRWHWLVPNLDSRSKLWVNAPGLAEERPPEQSRQARELAAAAELAYIDDAYIDDDARARGGRA
jgi:hypothetical protein